MNHPYVIFCMKRQNWKFFSNKGKSYVKCTSPTSAPLLKRTFSLTEKFFKKKKNHSPAHIKKNLKWLNFFMRVISSIWQFSLSIDFFMSEI